MRRRLFDAQPDVKDEPQVVSGQPARLIGIAFFPNPFPVFNYEAGIEITRVSQTEGSVALPTIDGARIATTGFVPLRRRAGRTRRRTRTPDGPRSERFGSNVHFPRISSAAREK